MTDPTTDTQERWLGPGVAGIGTASFFADVGHEIPTALLPNLLTATLGAPAAALGLIEGISDGLAGAVRLAGGDLDVRPRPPVLREAFADRRKQHCPHVLRDIEYGLNLVTVRHS